MTLRDRLTRALSVRMHPYTIVTVPVLAEASGFGEATIRRARSGHTTHIDVEMLVAIDAVFAKRGLGGFLAEVLGPVLAHQPGARPMSDLCWWITAEGRLQHAATGHAAYVVEAQAADGIDGDWAAYAIRALGWIEVTMQADGRVALRLSVPRVAPAALARAGMWLGEPRGVLAGLELQVLDRGRWTAQQFDTIAGAQRALERIALLDGTAGPVTTRLAAERRALDRLGDPAMAAALAAWSGPDTPVAVLRGALGADVARSALFGADGGGFVARALGDGITGIGGSIVGRNLRQLYADGYWSLVEGHLALAAGEGPTLHRIAVTTATDRGAYDRLALPVRDDDGTAAVQIVSHIHQPPQATVLH